MDLPQLILIFALVGFIGCQSENNSPTRVLSKFFGHCSTNPELIRCLKIQALKVTQRALNIKSFHIIEGLDIVGNNRQGKSVNIPNFNESKLEKLSNEDLDALLGDRAGRFLDTHRVEINIPKLVDQTEKSLESEGRDKKDKGGGYGPLLAALAIKGSFLAVAYKGIAIMSGTAILIGKMALILSAILGLKKLVNRGQEKTTFEIIKTPKYSEDHIHSTTFEDDHHEHFRRNYMDPGETHKRIYRFHIPERF